MLTAPGAKALYEQRFPGKCDSFWQVLPNGFDEEIFAPIKSLPDSSARRLDAPYVLLHSGLIYPSERDPTQLFEALAELKREGGVDRKTLRLSFRATGHDALYPEQIRHFDIDDLVELEPAIPTCSRWRQC